MGYVFIFFHKNLNKSFILLRFMMLHVCHQVASKRGMFDLFTKHIDFRELFISNVYIDF